jgi:hypothetical protein
MEKIHCELFALGTLENAAGPEIYEIRVGSITGKGFTQLIRPYPFKNRLDTAR